MKIALLNLAVDNNYGGHLQRYALTKVLTDMGHKVVHINYRFAFDEGSVIFRLYRDFKRLILCVIGKYSGPIRKEYRAKMFYVNQCKVTDKFYNKYVPHSKAVYDRHGMLQVCRGMDCLIIGSDQVWRKDYEGNNGIGVFFGDFIRDLKKTKIFVYGASFGLSSDAFSMDEKDTLSQLYSRFSSVSVREESGLSLLQKYGWNVPRAELVLDPTLLLAKNDYLELIQRGKTIPSPGDLFCYILDPSEEKRKKIDEIVKNGQYSPFSISINGQYSIEQWLRSFAEAKYVVTDSYHGLLFSIIMRKPFYVFYNSQRGNARFDSVFSLFGITNDGHFNWEEIESKRNKYRSTSIEFLFRSLNNLE